MHLSKTWPESSSSVIHSGAVDTAAKARDLSRMIESKWKDLAKTDQNEATYLKVPGYILYLLRLGGSLPYSGLCSGVFAAPMPHVSIV